MSAQNMFSATGIDHPYPGCTILRCTNQAGCTIPPEMIWLPRNSQTPLRVSLELSGTLSRDWIPDPYCLVHGASGDLFAFGAPCDSQNPACVSLQCLRGSAGIGIP